MVCKPTTLGAKYASTMLKYNSSYFNENILTIEDIINREQNPAENYDRDKLLDSSRKLNDILRRTNLTKWPLTNSRVQQGIILYPEVADFINQSGYSFDEFESILNDLSALLSRTPDINLNTASNLDGGYDPTRGSTSLDGTLIGAGDVDALNAGSTFALGENGRLVTNPDGDMSKLLDQMELYNTENLANSINSGTCGAFGDSPFGQIAEAVAAVGLAKKLFDLLGSFLDGFDLGSFLSELGSIETIIKKAIDTIVDKVKQQINNVISKVTGLVNQIREGAEKFLKTVQRKIEDVKAFFNDLSVESIKNQVSDFISQAKNQFEELTPEALALLMFRFCKFSEFVQSFFQSPMDLLKGFVDDTVREFKNVASISLEETRSAVANGAIRLPATTREEMRRRLRERVNARANANPNPRSRSRRPSGTSGTPGATVGDYPDPSYYVTSADISPEVRGQLMGLTPSGIAGKFAFAESVKNMGKTVSDAGDDDGFLRVLPEVWTKIYKVADRMGTQLTINSGYRSPQYNRRIGGATRSMHMSGKAIDVSMAGRSDDEIKDFIRIASQEGFKGMKVYFRGSTVSFIHVDVGTRRTWNSSGRFQNWITAHLRDEYRTGVSAPPPRSSTTAI